MKVAPSSNKMSKKAAIIIPLEEEADEYKLSKDNSTSWELRTVPTNANSTTYKVLVRILEGNETPRQICRWHKDVIKICLGTNATTLEAREPIMEACMRPGPLNIFRATTRAYAETAYHAALEAAEQQDRTAGDTTASDAVKANGVDHYRNNDHLDVALQEVVTNHMPRKVLAKVKRNLRRDMRKPLDMGVRKYYQAISRINDEELPHLPPFGNGQFLGTDEILDILLFGTPRSWQAEMDRQGFDPIEKGLLETVDFMENIESTEDKPYQEVKPKSKKKSSTKETGDSESSSKKKMPHYCKVHGPNYTHDTSDCRAAKKEKSSKGSYPNKTWSRKADEVTSASKKELAALVAKTIKKEVKAGVKKQLASVTKKRKSGDADSDEECCLVQMLEKNLDGFNYQQMESLSISDKKKDGYKSDGEISV